MTEIAKAAREGCCRMHGQTATRKTDSAVKLKPRAGTTLLETLVALMLLGMLITATLNLVREETRAFNSGTLQMDAMQTVRFTMSVLEKDMATVGTNVGPDQPFLVYADTHVVVFNADHTSRTVNDAFAVYVDTAAPNAATSAVGKARRFQIPRTSVFYPDTSYQMSGANSPAETIIFFFAPDPATSRTDDYSLFRQVNDQAADLIASGILKMTGFPFFQYNRLVRFANGTDSIRPVTTLPLRHSVALHGVAADTSPYSVIDGLRSIRVNFRVSDLGPPGKERIFPAARAVWFANAGIAIRQTCGDDPILGTLGFTVQAVTIDGVPTARLSWDAATDETTGEQDVIRYVIYRSESVGPVGDPYLSIPAGEAAYVYEDSNVVPGTTYYYSIAAQDCTPMLSSIVAAPALLIN